MLYSIVVIEKKNNYDSQNKAIFDYVIGIIRVIIVVENTCKMHVGPALSGGKFILFDIIHCSL